MRVVYYDEDGKMFEGLMVEHFMGQGEQRDKKEKVTQEAKPERADLVIVGEKTGVEGTLSLVGKFDPEKIKAGDPISGFIEATPVVLLKEVPRRDAEHPTNSYKPVN